MPSYGRYQVAEPPSQLIFSHMHDGMTPLKPVVHDVPVAVLDQEDLHAQHIVCSEFISGAGDPDALGSCTANTAIETAAIMLTLVQFTAFIAALLETAGRNLPSYEQAAGVYTDTVTLEIAAIIFYHLCTFQTGNPGQEWPTTDCGSSGVYIVQLLEQFGVCSGAQIASGADNIISLLQGGPIMMGGPFLNDWEQVGSDGIVDGNGRILTLTRQLRDGIAGGHETTIYGIAKLAMTRTGHVDDTKTVLYVRNHWTRSWGDAGDYLMHLSTIIRLAHQFDLRQPIPALPASS